MLPTETLYALLKEYVLVKNQSLQPLAIHNALNFKKIRLETIVFNLRLS